MQLWSSSHLPWVHELSFCSSRFVFFPNTTVVRIFCDRIHPTCDVCSGGALEKKDGGLGQGSGCCVRRKFTLLVIRTRQLCLYSIGIQLKVQISKALQSRSLKSLDLNKWKWKTLKVHFKNQSCMLWPLTFINSILPNWIS